MFYAAGVFPQAIVPAVPVWRGALGGVALCPPSCRDGVVVVVCDGGFVRAFSYAGRDLWTYRVRGRLAPFVTRGPDGISWVARDEAGGPKSLIALNRVGRKISEIRFDKPFTAPPEAGRDGRIFVPFDGVAAAYTLSGQKLGESKAGLADYNGFAPLRDPIYPDITLTMTRAESREPGSEWVLDIVGAAALPAYNGDGLVIAGGQNWLLAAYRVKDASPPSAPKPPETYGLASWASPPAWVSLEGITAALDKGNVGGNERVFASFLMETCRVTPGLNIPAAGIAERVEALALLGRLGSPEYVPFLIDVLNRTSSPLVKAAAIRAIGAIGIDRDGKAMNAFIKEALPVFPTSDTLIGRLDPKTGEIVPTSRRNKVETQKILRLFCGASCLFDAIGEKIGLTDDLRVCFPQAWRQILSIAYYLILEDRNPLSRFPRWAATHQHTYGRDISSQRSSELFAAIGEDSRQQFFGRQRRRRVESEFWGYDTTSISSYSQSLRQTRYGLNKEHDFLEQINLALLFGEESALPFYYRKLPGNISDIKTVKQEFRRKPPYLCITF